MNFNSRLKVGKLEAQFLFNYAFRNLLSPDTGFIMILDSNTELENV